MNHFNVTEEEKQRILKQHKDATAAFYNKKTETKLGLQKPESKKEEPKKIEPKKPVVAQPVKKVELKPTTPQKKVQTVKPGTKPVKK